VVLNDTAQSIIEEMRGQHPPIYVFTWVNEQGVRDRVGRIRNSGWTAARRRASERYAEVLGREAPWGAAGLASLIAAANRLTRTKDSPVLTVIRLVA
jgi:hypothetical protein